MEIERKRGDNGEGEKGERRVYKMGEKETREGRERADNRKKILGIRYGSNEAVREG